MRFLLSSLMCLLALTACDTFAVHTYFTKPGVEGACAGVTDANCLEFHGADPNGVFKADEVKVVCISGTSQLLATPTPGANPSGGPLQAFGLAPGSSEVGAVILPTGTSYAYILATIVQPGQSPVAQLLKVPQAELAAFSAAFGGPPPPAGSKPFVFSDLIVIGQAASGITMNANKGATFIDSKFSSIQGLGGGASASPSPGASQNTQVSSVTLSGVLTCKGALKG
jgi:hypothetical protein